MIVVARFKPTSKDASIYTGDRLGLIVLDLMYKGVSQEASNHVKASFGLNVLVLVHGRVSQARKTASRPVLVLLYWFYCMGGGQSRASNRGKGSFRFITLINVSGAVSQEIRPRQGLFWAECTGFRVKGGQSRASNRDVVVLVLV